MERTTDNAQNDKKHCARTINVLKIDGNRCKQTEINYSLLWVLQVIESIPYLVQSIGQ